MKISDIYKECIDEGWSKDKTAGYCLGILTSGLIDATDEESYERLKQELINKMEIK